MIEVEGATDDQLTTLYSNLYRLNLYPNSAFENTGTAASPVYMHAVQSSSSFEIPAGTTTTQTGAPVVPGKVYVNNGFWDTYRTTGRRTRCSIRPTPASSWTASSSSTATAAGSRGGRRRATRTS